MKKVLLLTGICILSACGGGDGVSTPISGGATAGKPAEGRPNINEDSFPRETRKSNSEVTSMMSQIFIPKGNVGDGYNMYTLQDVKFISSEDTPTDEDYITFGINDKGVIENLIIHDDTDTITMERDRDNIFNIPGYKYQIPYISDGEPKVWTSKIFLTKITDKSAIIDQITDENIPADKKDAILANFDKGEWGSYLLTSTFQMFGKYVSKNGLQYSDFGYNTTKVSDGQLFDYDVVAGGYTIYQIPADKIASQSLTFTGKAVGTISYTNTQGQQISEISTDNNATKLVFEKGKETLTMPFNEYYTVTVEKDGNTSNIKFTDWKGTDSKFKFTNETVTSDDVWIMYYGKDNNPSEAVGTIEHSEDFANRPTFDAGFGVQVEQ